MGKKKNVDKTIEEVREVKKADEAAVAEVSAAKSDAEEGKKKVSKKKKAKVRGEKYKSAVAKIKKGVDHEVSEAIKLVKESSYGKFDATVELHVNLSIDMEKNKTRIQFAVALPHLFQKQKRVLAFNNDTVPGADLMGDDTTINKIANGDIKPRRDFDEVIAHPSFMPKLAKIAKVLGPAGMMPNPKKGTITEKLEEAIKEIKVGKFEVKSEINAPIIHTVLGKTSFSEDFIKENFEAILKEIKLNKPLKTKGAFIKSAYISSSISPSVRVKTD